MEPSSEHHGSKRKSTTIMEHALTSKATVRSLRSEWQPPPVPPIPAKTVEMSWQRRSMKRESYTSSTFKTPSADDVSAAQLHHKTRTNNAFRPQSTYFPVLQRLRSRETGQPSSSASWEDHPANPQRWRPFTRWLHVVSALIGTFTVTLASSVNAPTALSFQATGLSSTISILPHSLFLLGLSFAPLTGYLRTALSRKLILLISVIVLAIFTLIAAFVRNIASIASTRYVAGSAASVFIPTAAAVLLDIFPAGRRTGVFTLFATTIIIGTVLGPLFGSIVIGTRSLPWTEYIVLMCAAASIVSFLPFRETSHISIASRTGISMARANTITLKAYCTRLVELVRLRGVWASMISFSAISAITFSLLQELPAILAKAYSFGPADQGCMLLALLCGCVIGIVSLVTFHRYSYTPKRTQWEDNFVSEWDKYEKQQHRSQIRRKTKSFIEARSSRILSMDIRPAPEPASPMPNRMTKGHSPGFAMSPGLAVAIASEIDARPSTVGSYVSAEQVWTIAMQKATFADVLDELELQYAVRLDRVKMIQLYESWSSNGARTSMILTTPLQMPEYLAEPKSLVTDDVNHRALALAALESGDTTSVSGSGSTKTKKRSLYFNAPLFARQRPPPAWRMWPALPSAVLSTIGLFILAWTTQTHWIVPAIGLGLYGCGAFTVAVCLCLFLVDTFGSEDIAHSLTIVCGTSYMAAFVSSMISLPMFAGLTSSWALSVLAFGSLLMWIAPLCLQCAGPCDNYYDNDMSDGQ